MAMRVLHVLSQRPALTGSGVTLNALAAHAARKGHEQRAVVGTPIDDPRPALPGMAPEHVYPLTFRASKSGEAPDVGFPLPGMSDVMPYESSRFSALTPHQLTAYREAWLRHLEAVVRSWKPDIVHSHHLWLLSSLIKDVLPDAPQVIHVHGTGFRQMMLAPEVGRDLREPLRRADAFAVLQGEHAAATRDLLQLSDHPVEIVGAGYRDDLFQHPDEPSERPPTILYAGKLAAAKGLPELLDAVTLLRGRGRLLRLEVAGGGGLEAEALRRRLRDEGDHVVWLGRLDQAALAEAMRRARVFALPSYYEGLPLVLVEALASGCRLVATKLSGIVDGLAGEIGDACHLVDLPRLVGPDRPLLEDVPAFVERLAAALGDALDAAPILDGQARARPFTWDRVCARVESLWNRLGPTS